MLRRRRRNPKIVVIESELGDGGTPASCSFTRAKVIKNSRFELAINLRRLIIDGIDTDGPQKLTYAQTISLLAVRAIHHIQQLAANNHGGRENDITQGLQVFYDIRIAVHELAGMVSVQQIHGQNLALLRVA